MYEMGYCRYTGVPWYGTVLSVAHGRIAISCGFVHVRVPRRGPVSQAKGEFGRAVQSCLSTRASSDETTAYSESKKERKFSCVRE
jgi:hypothetical protein